MIRRPYRQGRRSAGVALSLSLALHLLVLLLWSYHSRLTDLPPREPVPAAPFVKRQPPAQRPLARQPVQPPPQRPLQRAPAATPSRPPLAFGPQPLSRRQAPLPGVPLPMLTHVRPPAVLPPPSPLPPTVLRPGPHWQPGTVDGAVEGVRQAADEIDLRLELLSVDALDTGRHRALVVVDPQERRHLKGFLYLSSIYSYSIEQGEASSPHQRHLVPGRITTQIPAERQVAERQSLQGLAEQMNRHTQVRTQVLDGLAMDDPRLLQAPFLLLTALAPFQFTQVEARNLGQYLLAGGFVYAEVVTPLSRTATADEDMDLPALRDLIRQAFHAVGYREGPDWRFERLEMSHPLFHCYYDVTTLPRGMRDMHFWYWASSVRPEPTPPYLEAIMIGEHMAGVYSMKNYAEFWAGVAEQNRERDKADGFLGAFDIGGEELPVYKLGVNLLVYALTREGSLAQRLMAAE